MTDQQQEAPIRRDAPAEQDAPAERDAPAGQEAAAEREAPTTQDALAGQEAPAEEASPTGLDAVTGREAPAEEASPTGQAAVAGRETPVEDGSVAPPASPAPMRKDRRALWTALRWTAAALVFAAVGASTAYGLTRAERTDLPGLATASDGRWDYPELTRPPLPSGRPGPLDTANKAGSHYADLRALVLPAPKGARADTALRGKDGWLPAKDFLSVYAEKEDREDLGAKLADHGLRHVAARGWTMPDGTRTRIYLLQFGSATVAEDLYRNELSHTIDEPPALRGAALSVFDEDWPEQAAVPGENRSLYVESEPYGAEQVRQAYLSAGDVVALVTQSRKGGAKAVPFQQTVVLQGELLG